MKPGDLRGRLLLTLPQDARDLVARCLRGFSSPSDEQSRSGKSGLRVSVPWGDPLDPWTIRFFVVDVVGGRDIGRAEKQAWAAALEMDGVLIWFVHMKFGVFATVYGIATEEGASDLVRDCLRRMEKAAPVVRQHLIDPLINEAVEKGSFTVPNRFEYFLSMYSHLRSLSDETGARAKETEPITKSFAGGGSTFFAAAQVARQAEFEAVGALFAVFSLLEHLLVIGLALVEYDPEIEPFGNFLRLNWGEKFKRVVGLDHRDDKVAYDTLKCLADENRNPAAHGGVDRGVTNVDVHLRGYGAVPTSVSANSARPEYTFEPHLPRSVHPFAEYHFLGRSSDGWEAVDRALAWMRSGR